MYRVQQQTTSLGDEHGASSDRANRDMTRSRESGARTRLPNELLQEFSRDIGALGLRVRALIFVNCTVFGLCLGITQASIFAPLSLTYSLKFLKWNLARSS